MFKRLGNFFKGKTKKNPITLPESATSPAQLLPPSPKFVTTHETGYGPVINTTIGSHTSNRNNSKPMSHRSVTNTPKRNPSMGSPYKQSHELNRTISHKNIPSVLAMTFNIGDADISAMDFITEFKKNNPLDNIFYKMMQLHFENKVDLPNIIVIGLQEVQDKDVTNITTRFETELNNIVNWDETNSIITGKNIGYIKNVSKTFKEKHYRFCAFESDKDGKPTNYVKTCNFNFNILTMVLYSEEKISAPKISHKNIHTYCPTLLSSSGEYKNKIPTKGFVITKFEYSNRIPTEYQNGKPVGFEIVAATPLHIVNMHAPFKSEKASKQFFADLSQHMTNMGIRQSDNVIILGDYNSRSLLYNDEYVKNIDNNTCEKGNYNEYHDTYNFSTAKYCNMKSDLEELKLNPHNNNNTTSKLYSQLYGDEEYTPTNSIDKTNEIKNINRLIATNSFQTKSKSSLWGGILSEYRIRFLPTYKRVTRKDYLKSLKKCKTSNPNTNCNVTVKKSGEFDLSVSSFPIHKLKYIAPEKWQTTVLRLPGYADRIMVAGQRIKLFNENMYTSIPVFGNDHLPVVASFVLN